jgi:hypothetical protein
MIAMWIAPIGVVVLVAIILAVTLIRKKQPEPPKLRLVEPDPAESLFANGNRPTEDDIAQARLGGTRGARKLGAAPMTPQLEENTPPPADPGHVA